MDGSAAVIGASVFAVAATVVPWLRHEAWWIRGFDFPRVQFLALAAVILVLNWADHGLREPSGQALGLLLALCVVYQAYKIVPYCPLHPKQLLTARDPSAPCTVSILIANVYTPNREAGRLVELIDRNDPDIVLAVETDAWWEARLDAIEAARPHTVKHPLDNT